MKNTTFIILLVIFAFGCGFLPESQAGPPQVPGYKGPSHAQHPPGYRGPSHAQNPPGMQHHSTPRPALKGNYHPGVARPPVVHHGPSHHPGFYPPPPPPPRIPVYLYPPVVVSYPIVYPTPTYTETYTETYYEDEPRPNPASDMKQIGIFRAYVYKDDESDEVQQNGVAVFYLNDQNLIGGYFYIKADAQPLTIQGIADPKTGEVEFRVNGTSGTYYTKLNQLITRDKIFLTLERENAEGKTEASEVGYLSRVQEKL